MSEVNETVARAAAKPGRGSRFPSRKIIALVLVAAAAVIGAAGYWYSAGRQPPQRAEERAAEAPFYLELKPFVVSIASNTGAPHFLQMGLDLALRAYPIRKRYVRSPSVRHETDEWEAAAEAGPR